MKAKYLAALAGLALAGSSAHAQVTFTQVTNDADSGISSGDTYTHAIDFGSGVKATVNGVTFVGDFGTASGSIPNTGSRTYGPNINPGNAPPAVAGSVAEVFRDMLFNGPNGGNVVLTGLTPNQWYDLRLYDRAWDHNLAIRPVTASYDVDSDLAVEFTAPTYDTNRGQDAPVSLGNVSWVTSYIYQAGAAGSITVSLGIGGTGTYHLYGLTNVETVAPSDPPSLTGTDPANGAPAVPTYANLEATFDKNIAAGTGNITIKNLTDASDTVIPAGDPQVSIAGSVLTINPGTNLLGTKDYAIQIDALAIEDTFGNPFGGILDNMIWNFTTAAEDVTDPIVSTLSPADDAPNVAPITDLVITFDENVQKGTGNIEIFDGGGLVETIDVNSGAVTISGSQATINPVGILSGLTAYYVQVAAGAFEDLAGNAYAGIIPPDTTSWSFTTVEAGEITFVPIFDDFDAGLDPLNTYTHALDFGNGAPGALINGVQFDAYNGAANGTLDFNRTVTSGSEASHGGNGNHNVLGGLIDLMTDMYFNGSNAAGGMTTWTLSGLTPGVTYDTRIYVRQWGVSSGRLATMVFDPDGAGPISDSPGEISEDEATSVGMPADNTAYYISYTFTAVAGEDLVITVTQPNFNNSWHLYGLSNQVVPGFAIAAAPLEFTSAVTQGNLISALTGAFTGVPEATTFTFAAGLGDTDNGKFQISGQELQAGTHNFAGDADGTTYSVRLLGTGDVSAESEERVFTLTLSADADGDNLPDAWEILWANNITTLSGLGGANADGDTLTDLEEYNLSLGAYPNIDPTNSDTDGDSLGDGAEIAGAGARPPTDPTNPDTDGDGLLDVDETGTGTFVNGTDTGTDPTDTDTDGDSVPDNVEITNGTDPNDPADFLPGGFAVTKLTSDATSGINPLKTYTHTITGGEPATVNGVVFDVLDPATTPPNFNWTVATGVKAEVVNNNGDWDSFSVGLSGTELEQLLDSFSYNSDGTPGASQTFTLSGLTPGQTYDLRLYIRIWSTLTVRPILLKFTNGAIVIDPMIALPEDLPGDVLANGDNNCAYFLSLEYTADSTELVIEATVPPGGNGSYHLYGLTNEVATSGFYTTALDNDTFGSWNVQGDLVGTLSATLDAALDPSTFTLVTGAGDTDNGKFQIVGSELQVGAFDFSGAGSTDGQQFFVRIEGVGASGMMGEQEYVLTISKDDDNDGLNDAWELQWAGNLIDLDGLGGDFDGDNLSDLDEFELSTGVLGGPYPLIDPTVFDTDSDGISDGEEVFPTVGVRPTTDPTNADTDGDGLSDLVETGTFLFVDANDTGTDPTLADTDGDCGRDGAELAAGSDPFDPFDNHPVPLEISLVQVTDDTTAGIDAGKTYTHAISGGNAVTVNGVNFEVLTPAITPANFTWDTHGFNKNQVLDNLNGWIPANGGLTGPGFPDLFDSFVYSGNGGNPGGIQTFTLSGLTPGQSYQVRLYIRAWAVGGTRLICLTFHNGTEIITPGVNAPEDSPAAVLMNGNDSSAYYVAFDYTAQTTELSIEAAVPSLAALNNGSFHMYGLSNEQTLVVGTPITITSVLRAPGGQIVLNYTGAPNTTYNVTKSADLTVGSFGPLTVPQTTTTDFAGGGQAVIPASEASELFEFYRLEE